MSVTVVTGATGTLGAAVVDRLLRDGHAVAAPVRNAARAPAGVLARNVDLLDEAAVAAFAAEVESELGPPTGLVCAAGGFQSGSVAETALVDLRAVVDLNLATAYTATRAVLPAMRRAGGGSIVYVGSRAALRPFAGGVGPIVAKAALHALAEVVAIEEREHRIRATVVVPRVIDTPANRAGDDAAHPDWTPPARIADAVAWLLTDDAAVTTGGLIPVDGPV